MKTIIYAHPWEGSYNHAILETLCEDFRKNNEAFQLIDLYQDKFDPVLGSDNLRLYSKGATNDPLVTSYQELLKQTDELIFIFPIWWFGLPAILKGFIDKVMLDGFAYTADADGNLTGLLTHIQKTTVIATSTIDQDYIKNAVESVIINGILKEIGLLNERTQWLHFDRANLTTDERRTAFLETLPKLVAEK